MSHYSTNFFLSYPRNIKYRDYVFLNNTKRNQWNKSSFYVDISGLYLSSIYIRISVARISVFGTMEICARHG